MHFQRKNYYLNDNHKSFKILNIFHKIIVFICFITVIEAKGNEQVLENFIKKPSECLDHVQSSEERGNEDVCEIFPKKGDEIEIILKKFKKDWPDKTQFCNTLEELVNQVNEAWGSFEGSNQNTEKEASLTRIAKNLIQEVRNIEIVGKEKLLSRIANYYHQSLDYNEALLYWKELLEYQQRIYRENHTDVAESLNNIGLAYIGLEDDIQKGLKYLEESLEMYQALFPGNHTKVANLLNYIGLVHFRLHKGLDQYEKAIVATFLSEKNPFRAQESIMRMHLEFFRGLTFLKKALIMRQSLFSGDHPSIEESLKNVWLGYKIYGSVGSKENYCNGVKYLVEALIMKQALLPKNDPSIIDMLTEIGQTYRLIFSQFGGNENLWNAGKYLMDALIMCQAQFPGNNPTVAKLLREIGNNYLDYGKDANFQEGIKYLEKALLMYQSLFPGNHVLVAETLKDVGEAYQKLEGESKQKGLIFLEESLKIYFLLNEHSSISTSLFRIGLAYLQLFNDKDKCIEYAKQAYSIAGTKQQEILKPVIETDQSNFFTKRGLRPILEEKDCVDSGKVGFECRKVILSRGKVDDRLLKVKQAIQVIILNRIHIVLDWLGWTYEVRVLGDWGVKGFIARDYIKEIIELTAKDTLDDENIELAQMLCFEAINIGIMKSEKKPYEVVEIFARENPELVRKIAEEHPEFFVDGSIVDACLRGMSENEAFIKLISEHIKYMGMEERSEKFFKTVSRF